MSTCRACGATYSPNGGGHCSGPPFGGCCRTFASDAAFDKHRVGSYVTGRSCLDVTTADGWRETPRGWTNSKPMDPAALARRKGEPSFIDFNPEED